MDTSWRLGSSRRGDFSPNRASYKRASDTGAADVAEGSPRPRVETALVELINYLNQSRIPEASCSPRAGCAHYLA